MTSGFTLMNSVTPVRSLRPNRNLSVQPKHTTRSHRFHHRKTNLPLIPNFCLLQLHSMILVLYQHHFSLAALFSASRTKPICDKNPEDPSWKLMSKGRERSHQSLIISLGGENTQGESKLQGSQMLGVQEERCYMSSRGERHVHMCLFALALFICLFEL